jgi:hypothetical protein
MVAQFDSTPTHLVLSAAVRVAYPALPDDVRGLIASRLRKGWDAAVALHKDDIQARASENGSRSSEAALPRNVATAFVEGSGRAAIDRLRADLA